MPDPRFFTQNGPIDVEAALALVATVDGSAVLAGSGDKRALLEVADPRDAELASAVVYCRDEAAITSLESKPVGLCLAPHGKSEKLAGGFPVIACKDPRLAFAKVAARLHNLRNDDGIAPQISETAIIHESAVVGAGAVIGAGVRIGPHVAIGPGVEIGDDSFIDANVSIQCALLGARAQLFPGVRIGGPGFGYAQSSSGIIAIPQLGRVLIGDDVDIGMNAVIDRGALRDTVIGNGVKMDNAVHIAHNVTIGNNCIFAAQVGISGSVDVGENVVMGGQVGVADHVSIGDGAMLAGRAGVLRDVPAGEQLGGLPAVPLQQWLRSIAASSRIKKKKAK